MNREIKFRAWIGDLGIMLSPVTYYSHTNSIGVEAKVLQDELPEQITICEDGIYKDDPENDVFDLIMTVIEGDDWYWFEEGQFEIMQFTGLRDRNGVEIFEGDVLKWHSHDGNVYENEVYFCVGTARTEYKIKNGSYTKALSSNGIFNAKAEIIGSIHDKELKE